MCYFRDRIEIETFEEDFLKKFETNIFDYEIIQIKEQVYYDMFPAKIKKYLLKN